MFSTFPYIHSPLFVLARLAMTVSKFEVVALASGAYFESMFSGVVAPGAEDDYFTGLQALVVS